MELVGKGIQYVIISLGRDGAVGSDGKGLWSAKPPAKKAINPVGSGDALVAGFLYAQLKGYSFARSLQTGVAVGTANSLSVNPGYFTKSQARQLIKKVRIKKL